MSRDVVFVENTFPLESGIDVPQELNDLRWINVEPAITEHTVVEQLVEPPAHIVAELELVPCQRPDDGVVAAEENREEVLVPPIIRTK